MKLGLQGLNARTKRWLMISAGALATYTTAGFWLVPWVLETQIPRIGESVLARQANVSDIRLNPYTLRLGAQDLRLSEADGAPLFGVGELAVELQWRSLVRRAWSFADISLTAPVVQLSIAEDGSFNLARLAESLRSEDDPDAEEASLPRLVVERFAVAQGRIDMQDRKAGYSNSFAPIDFSLSRFSTLPERDGNYTFRAELASGGALTWRGDISVNPIRGSGELALENASLPEPSVYLKPYTSATVHAGRFDAALPYRFAYQDGRLDASLAGARLALQGLAFSAPERADSAPARASADMVQLGFDLALARSEPDLNLALSNVALSVDGLALAEGERTPFRMARIGLEGGAMDLARREAGVERVFAEDGALEVARDTQGQIDLLALLQRFAAVAGPAASNTERPDAPSATDTALPDQPWAAVARRVELRRFDSRVADEATGIAVNVEDFNVTLEDAGSDLSRPVRFDAALRLRDGGSLAVQGSATPASSSVQANVQVDRLALAPLQPLLSQYVKLRIGGSVSAKGQLAAQGSDARKPALRYDGSFEIASLALDEDNGERFAGWKSVRADRLSASVAPNRLEIPELRVVEPRAILIIEQDRSFNAARLLVQPPAQAAPASAPLIKTAHVPAGERGAAEAKQGSTNDAKPDTAADSFPVRIDRVRFQNAKLDFTDLSLLPQFTAKIYDLNGVITGLSSRGETRSQIELDGRVDDFGMARIRGGLNAFAFADRTNVDLQFKNLDMLSVSPYSMKFAGYKIADGKLSLDLRYKLRDRQLEGENRIVIDKLTLGEKIDSPDAMNLPLELAIAILKDSEGRIDLDLPVTGDLDDPQFSYGAVIWKAISNVITKVVTAPFRALGALLGGGTDDLEAIAFDPGSDRLLPPEREKLVKVAQILGKRPQLKLLVPGQYNEAVDGSAMRLHAVRVEVGKRAGIETPKGEAVGPLPLRDARVRRALRELYAERFGEAELKKVTAAAEAAEAGAADDGRKTRLSAWQRLGNMLDGEPQLADAGEFYRRLQDRLVQQQPLAGDAFGQLARQRAQSILGALRDTGVTEASVAMAAVEATEAPDGKAVPLKLGLTSK